MNRVLVFCWREWRAQRGVLLGYCGLVFAVLTVLAAMAPSEWWTEPGHGALALSGFVAAGVIGVLVFAAPGLVRCEFGNGGGRRDDQFVRRLPGALWPSFGGKLLFLGLATLSLPLLGLAAGELSLTALGQTWADLFVSHGGGDVVVEWPWPAVACGWAALLVPWVWAFGTWLPGGRMAVGGTALFVLSIGLVVTAVLRQCPDLEKAIAWRSWLWGVAPFGVVVAGLSWIVGRRGGGVVRSARCGVAALLVGLAPPAVWFGHAAHRFHNPDPQQLTSVHPVGISPDLRFVLVAGSEIGTGAVTFRIDLATGGVERVGGFRDWFTPVTLSSAFREGRTARYWQGERDDEHALFDLANGSWTPVRECDATGRIVLPPHLRALVTEQLLAETTWRGPGGPRVAVLGNDLATEGRDGSWALRPFAHEKAHLLRAAGHGFHVWSGVNTFLDGDGRAVDAAGGDRWGSAFLVRDRWLFTLQPRKGAAGWHQLEPDGREAPCEPLRDAVVLGLCDDDRVLACVTARNDRVPRLFLYAPADHTVHELAVPPGVAFRMLNVVCPLAGHGSLLPRDPAGRIWLHSWRTNAKPWRRLHESEGTLLVDPTTGAVAVRADLDTSAGRQLLGWPDAASVLLCEGHTIDRVDIATGARTRLFPR